MNTAATLNGLGQSFIYVVTCIGFIWLAKHIDDWRTRDFNDDDHIDNGNAAVGLRRAGLYLGISIALAGAMSGSARGFFQDWIQLIIDGLVITGFMFSCRYINDFMMLGHVDNDRECIREFTNDQGVVVTGNTAVGIVEAGMYLATGFILNGAVSGSGGTFFQGIASAILFFVLGQLALLIFGLIYEMVTPFNVRQEIKKNNLAAGIGLGGILVALGLVLRSSIAGPFTGWQNDLTAFAIYALFGIVMLLGFRAVADRILLPTTDIATEVKEDQNAAALIVIQSAVNAVAIIIAASL